MVFDQPLVTGQVSHCTGEGCVPMSLFSRLSSGQGSYLDHW